MAKISEEKNGLVTENFYESEKGVVQKRSVNHQPILEHNKKLYTCLLYTSPSPRDGLLSRMPSSA